MRVRASLMLMLVVAALLVPASLGNGPGGSGPSPMDSTVRYSAGHYNTSFTDSASKDVPTTVFYPATAEGENATKDPRGAPYPVLMMVPHEGVGAVHRYYGSYGGHLAERGFLVAMVDLTAYGAGPTLDHERMGNSTLDALEFVVSEGSRTGSAVQGMVNSSAMALAGHGRGGRVALHAAYNDGDGDVQGVACLGLLDQANTSVVDEQVAHRTGLFPGPLHLETEPPNPSRNRSLSAFRNKASGYVSYMMLNGANFTQYMDETPPAPVHWDPPALISRGDQHNLTNKYLLAFLDRHLKGDALAGEKLYGAQARADLDTGVLDDWRYGVRDQGLVVTTPVNGSLVPDGPLDICATVSNTGPFPMPARNVTLEIARVVGQALTWVHGPENRTVTAQGPGASEDLGWTHIMSSYGGFRLFVRMKDPDHNSSNDEVVVDLTVTPLEAPTIEHDPPASMELGVPSNLTFRIAAPSGVDEALLLFRDVEGLEVDLAMSTGGAADEWYVHVPAQPTTGQVSYTVSARAGNGATNATNPFYVPVEDSLPPVISHLPPWTELPVNTQVDVCATVTDNGDVETVRLAYTDPTTGFHNVSCGRRGDLWLYPVVLGPVAGDLEYRWYAVDSWGNGAELGPVTVPVLDEGPPVIEPVPADPTELGDQAVLEARVTDDAHVEEVWVAYRSPDTGGAWTNGTPVAVGDLHRLMLEPTMPGDVSYRWHARDVNGGTSSSDRLVADVVDTTPPTISGVGSGNATVGARPWVEATVVDVGGLARVVVEYMDVEGVDRSVPMDGVLADLFLARLPVQHAGGELVYRVVADDPSGNRADSGNRTVVVRDISPPVIDHTPPRHLVAGQEVTFEARVTDDVGVESVVLHLKLSGSPAYRPIEMVNTEGDTYAYTLPAGELRFPAVVYYLHAEDLPPFTNEATLPGDAPDSAIIVEVLREELRLFGTVRASGGDPVRGARVELEGTNLTSYTDVNGSYEFLSLDEGTYTVKVTARGLEDFQTPVTLTVEDGDRRLDVNMVPLAGGGGGDGTSYGLLLAAVVVLVIAVLVPVVVVRTRGGGG